MSWIRPELINDSFSGLSPKEFVALANDFLVAAAIEHGLPRSCLATNLRVNDPDGGIDARCVDAPFTVPRIFPRADSAFQYKSGSSGGSPSTVAEDDILNKPRVRSHLEDGDGFVYIAAFDKGDAFEEDLTEAVREEIPVEDGQIVFIGGESFARQLQPFLGLVARHVLRFDENLLSIDDWNGLEQFRNPFEADEAVEQRLEDLRERVGQPGAILRVVGRPGDGKTRTVLEAMKGSELAPLTLYAPQREYVTPSLLSFLRRTRDLLCVLVVDEVDPEEAEHLAQLCSSIPHGGVRLITIGTQESGLVKVGPTESLRVEKLSDSVLTRAVRGVAQGLPEEEAGVIARECRGSPKLAILIARRIREEPSLADHPQRLADPTIRGILDHYLGIDPSNQLWHSVSALAMLERVGWSEDLAEQSEILFDALEQDLTDAREAVERAQELYGVAPRAGRYRYVSPPLLAEHLAARRLDRMTPAQIRHLVDSLSSPMLDSFGKRTRKLASALEENRAVVEKVVLGSEGPFRSLADVEEGERASLLSHLAAPFRRASLAALERIIAPASREELEAATKSRRALVRALQQLLWPEETFEGAARLLLELAEAENESWANNATGIWQDTFQTVLGRTAAGAVARLRVLRQAVTSPSPDKRRLAAEAIQSGIKSYPLSRVGTPPDDVEGFPSEAWSPESEEELSDFFCEYLELLEPLLSDEVVEVRRAASSALAEAVNTAVRHPRLSHIFETWRDIASQLADAPYELRSELVSAVDSWAERADFLRDSDTDELTDERERILDEMIIVRDQLAGEDFQSRLRRAITSQSWSPTKSLEERREELRETLATLAEEVLENPSLLAEELNWLLENQQANQGQFFYELGKTDDERVWSTRLEELALEEQGAESLLAIYDLGCADAAPDRDEFLLGRADELRDSPIDDRQVFELLRRAGYSEERFRVILDLFESGDIGTSSVDSLSYLGWTEEMSPGEVASLAEVITPQLEDGDPLVSFLYRYLEGREEVRDQLQEVAIRALRSSTEDANGNPQHDWAWAKLAEMYLTDRPTTVAQAAIRRIAQRGAGYSREVARIARRALKEGDPTERFFAAVAPILEAGGAGGWWVREVLSPLPVEGLNTDQLQEWIDEDPDNRAYSFARLVGGPMGDQPSELHALLLRQYGEYGVGDAFLSDMISGTFSGTPAQHTRGVISTVQRWTDDEREEVAEWARSSISNLGRMLEQEERREEEREF